MQRVIGVRFKRAGKIHFFDPGDDDIQAGESVIVETTRGLECGDVVIGTREIPQAENPAGVIPTMRRIHRKATKADLARVEENHEKELEAFEICKEKIAEHRLPMNLINVRYTFDVSKIIFYFSSDGRVDFRLLVRDLAYIFRTRIELRQVGVREEARHLGGVGCCGRKLCCTTFLGDFAQVSIHMAKEQNLSLNPTKISGICGRLLCCLKFESEYYHECYLESHPNFEPQLNDRVILDEGEGRVVALDPVRRLATVLLDSNKTFVASWDDLLPEDADIVSKIPKDELTTDVDEIPLNDTVEEIKSAPAKNFGKKNFNHNDSASTANDSEDKRPWINRPRKPRRPRGKI